METYSPAHLILSGIGMSLLIYVIVLPGGHRDIAFRIGRGAFLSIGMVMIFAAWLQIINFNGGWPSDQPRDDNFYPTRADEQRIDARIDSNMNDADYADYHRCKRVNVCVRKFSGLRKS